MTSHGKGLTQVDAGCEFGACGAGASGFEELKTLTPGAVQQDPNDIISLSVGLEAVWGGISGVGKYVGCGAVGAGKGFQSFFGAAGGMQYAPPGPSTGLRAARGVFKIGAPGLMYWLSKSGPVARALGDLVPGAGEALIYAQTGLAINDGGRAAYACASQIE